PIPRGAWRSRRRSRARWAARLGPRRGRRWRRARRQGRRSGPPAGRWGPLASPLGSLIGSLVARWLASPVRRRLASRRVRAAIAARDACSGTRNSPDSTGGCLALQARRADPVGLASALSRSHDDGPVTQPGGADSVTPSDETPVVFEF